MQPTEMRGAGCTVEGGWDREVGRKGLVYNKPIVKAIVFFKR